MMSSLSHCMSRETLCLQMSNGTCNALFFDDKGDAEGLCLANGLDLPTAHCSVSAAVQDVEVCRPRYALACELCWLEVHTSPFAARVSATSPHSLEQTP